MERRWQVSSIGRWKPVELEKLAVLEVKAAMFDEAIPMLKSYRRSDDTIHKKNSLPTCTCRACYADELIARADELARRTQ